MGEWNRWQEEVDSMREEISLLKQALSKKDIKINQQTAENQKLKEEVGRLNHLCDEISGFTPIISL